MNELQYPIGKFIAQPFSQQQLQEWLLDIQTLPMHVEHNIENLDAVHLAQPYRPGGWTIQQLVHHIADSHMNAYTRFKLGLTEDLPSIKPYNEVAWAEMDDTKNLPINISVTLLYCVHQRMHEILRHLTAAQWQRRIYHPEHEKEISLWDLLGMYAWHGKHHVAHIRLVADHKIID